jgi:hypothetical protein
MKMIKSKFTMYYIATKILYVFVLAFVFLTPMSVTLLMLVKGIDIAQFIAISILILLCGSFVYRFIDTMTIIGFELSPIYFSIRNVLLMKSLKYQYSRIVKFYPTSGYGTEYATTTGEMALGNNVPGIYILFDDGFEVEMTSQDYQNLEEIWDVLCEKVS